ncbi:MAG TPA: MBL fold metallo-hydrolase, partial [Clostridia bacterium]|nr:MBL fold metallo-hydrolase [Clostridia bacterium]
MIRIIKFVAGYLSTNSYLVTSDLDNTAVLIDAGGGLDKIEKYLVANNLQLVALLLTHGHFDHIT